MEDNSAGPTAEPKREIGFLGSEYWPLVLALVVGFVNIVLHQYVVASSGAWEMLIIELSFVSKLAFLFHDARFFYAGVSVYGGLAFISYAFSRRKLVWGLVLAGTAVGFLTLAGLELANQKVEKTMERMRTQ